MGVITEAELVLLDWLVENIGTPWDTVARMALRQLSEPVVEAAASARGVRKALRLAGAMGGPPWWDAGDLLVDAGVLRPMGWQVTHTETTARGSRAKVAYYAAAVPPPDEGEARRKMLRRAPDGRRGWTWDEYFDPEWPWMLMPPPPMRSNVVRGGG